MNWNYLAGFFDGEGCIYFRVGAWNKKIHITQKGERGRKVLSEIQDFLQEHGIKSQLTLRSGTDYWMLWLCAQKDMTNFLYGVFPYLRVKKLEAQDLLRYFKLYPSIVGLVHTRKAA